MLLAPEGAAAVAPFAWVKPSSEGASMRGSDVYLSAQPGFRWSIPQKPLVKTSCIKPDYAPDNVIEILHRPNLVPNLGRVVSALIARTTKKRPTLAQPL